MTGRKPPKHFFPTVAEAPPEGVAELESPNGSCDAEADPRRIAALTFHEQRVPAYRYLVSLGRRPAVASEIVQEAFLRLHRHLRSKGRSENLRGWVFRVAHNLPVNELKRTGAADAGPADRKRIREAIPS